MKFVTTVRITLLLFFPATFLSGCLSSDKDPVKMGDDRLSCEDLRMEIAELADMEKEAETKSKLGLGGGVAAGAAGLFMVFPPLIIPAATIGGTAYGTQKSLESSEDKTRRLFLTQRYNEKGCSSRTASNKRTNPEVRRAQKALAEKGYNPGPADGIFGARTKNACTEFQKDQGLTVTGRLDPATIESLLK